MLQQTTVASVIANRRFEKFLDEFPDLETIAKAPESQLLRAWEGLGYYNRVRNLQKTAQAVLTDHDGTFPRDAQTLETLPGIGKYTAGAVSSFAFNEPAPTVDGNIARVIARLLDFHEPIDVTAGQKQIWAWAAELLPSTHPRDFNSAIMELGQRHCTARSAECNACPVSSFCQTNDPSALPIKKPRKKFVAVEEHALFIEKSGSLLLSLEEGSRRKGFWHLPLRDAEEVAHLNPTSTHRYTITHHKVSVQLYRINLGQLPHGLKDAEKFQPLEQLSELPMPSPIRRIIEGSLAPIPDPP